MDKVCGCCLFSVYNPDLNRVECRWISEEELPEHLPASIKRHFENAISLVVEDNDALNCSWFTEDREYRCGSNGLGIGLQIRFMSVQFRPPFQRVP